MSATCDLSTVHPVQLSRVITVRGAAWKYVSEHGECMDGELRKLALQERLEVLQLFCIIILLLALLTSSQTLELPVTSGGFPIY